MSKTTNPLSSPLKAAHVPGDSDTAPKGPDVFVPGLSSLAAKFPKRDSLYAHLATIPSPILVSMLLTQHKKTLTEVESKAYGPSNNLAHCVYCHQVFDKTATREGCKIEHFGELEWTCCGKRVRGYSEYYDDSLSFAEFDSPYCYEGVHSEREFQEGDVDVPEGKWWKNWGQNLGTSCSDLGCHRKPNGGHLALSEN